MKLCVYSASWGVLPRGRHRLSIRPWCRPRVPGVFTVKPSGPATFKLVVAGHTFTSRGEIEKYLAYRAARHTVEQGGTWFTLNEDRGKGETAVPVRRATLKDRATASG